MPTFTGIHWRSVRDRSAKMRGRVWSEDTQNYFPLSEASVTVINVRPARSHKENTSQKLVSFLQLNTTPGCNKAPLTVVQNERPEMLLNAGSMMDYGTSSKMGC
ncbi:hypothetical protein CEXT_333441 [Caerostris extrusa]|uniref:Uncharacterized protein n=1 Tax=Caerostris extrusa TaxID=172846 RepID=A0AAV4NFD3_CAEEX|nr:hypothetical protein CEXT_333441 [Caerostris extrusa]